MVKKNENNEIKTLSHSTYRCQYHIVFTMVFSITHRCVNFIRASCYSI